MKRVFFSIVMLVFATSFFAQEVEAPKNSTGSLVSKKGEPFLPESGDWAISFDASPVFRYVGNAFNGNTGNGAPSVDWLNGNQTIIGKLFLDDKTAIRGLLRLGFSNQTTKASIADAYATAPTYPTPFPQVEDKVTASNTIIGIGAGYEMRRGKTRLQGYYGGDAMIWYSSTKDKYAYGNRLTANTVTVTGNTTTNFGGNLTTDSYGNNARITENKSGSTFGIGVRGFIGAEYFIFPKIAIGAEYGWGIGFQSTGKGKSTAESVNAATTQVGSSTTNTSGSSKFGVDTDLNQNTIFGFKGSNSGNATVRVTFHF